MKVTLPYSSWQPNATNVGIINAMPVPANCQPVSFVLKPVISFTGGPVTTCDLRLKYPDDIANLITLGLDLFSPVNVNSGIISGVQSNVNSSFFTKWVCVHGKGEAMGT